MSGLLRTVNVVRLKIEIRWYYAIRTTSETFRLMDALSRALELLGLSLPEGVRGPNFLYAVGVVVAALILGFVIVRTRRRARRLSKPAPVIDSLPPNVEPPPPAVPEREDETPIPVVDPTTAVPSENDPLVRLTDVENNDPDLKEELNATRQLLNDGNTVTAVESLSRIGQMEHDAGRDLRRQADERLSGAATIHLVSGDLKLSTGDTDGSITQYAEAIETVPRGHDALLAECLNKHGAAAYTGGHLDVAMSSFKRAARILERIRGLNHPDVATAISNLAMLHYTRGDLAAAEPLYRRALEIDEATLGEGSHEVATDLNNMALLFKKQDRLEEAEPLFERALKIKEQQFDAGHPSLITGLKNYAGLLRDMGRTEEAEAYEARAEG
jgi:tetratricopeptide (TPR) repeat protein